MTSPHLHQQEVNFTAFRRRELAPRPHCITQLAAPPVWRHQYFVGIREDDPLALEKAEGTSFGNLSRPRSYRVLPVSGRLSSGGSKSNSILPWQGDHPPIDQRFGDGRLVSVISSSFSATTREKLNAPSCCVTSAPSFKANHEINAPMQRNNDVREMENR